MKMKNVFIESTGEVGATKPSLSLNLTIDALNYERGTVFAKVQVM